MAVEEGVLVSRGGGRGADDLAGVVDAPKELNVLRSVST